ncbi:ABC transporter transmembrane domain-containing protein [Flammeovirgaceae bacterium SG7u.111]|nr:ABC transporter transmembrane domain-containing protein [Flammeovirgaceae bacterium SG7u.132]WPO35549.1 ABC transporter transmembrane domain-containing protein [Flammeovirgaceae bacterium SG7u.111]
MARRKRSSEGEEKKKLDKKGLKKLIGIYRYVLPYKPPFIAGLISLLFSSTVLLSFPFFTGKLVDAATREAYVSWSIDQIALLLLGILVLQSIFSFLKVFFFAQVSERAMADIRKDLYKKFITLPLAFYDKHRSGALMSRITSDVTLLQDTFSVTLAEFVRQTSILLIGTTILFFVTPKLTFFMLAIIPVLVLIGFSFGKFIRSFSRKTQDSLAEANTVVEETLTAINIVKAFTNEVFEVNRYGKALDKTVGIALKAARFRGAFISFIIFALFGGVVLVLWYGANLVQEGELSIGDLTSFIFYTMFIGGSIAGLGDIFSSIQKAIGATERVLEILTEKSEHELDDITAAKKIKLEGNITFKDVAFSYPSRTSVEVLKKLNLTISSGEKIALIGHSGAGKSTIVQTLLRFYEVQNGQISVDSKNIYDYDINGYRANIAIVPQEVVLFGGSIKENIAYGKPDATYEEIKDAAEKANALGFINSFPEGFGTLVGERGIKLSGGQKQRIAIARAILKDPSILILDEATSSLDSESEQMVQQALEKLMVGRTTIIIAHRLSTIRKVDRIYVLEKGDIIESGNHDELSTLPNGVYNGFLKLQEEIIE